METNKDIGYYEELINGSQIVRARTIRLIRSWEFPRSLEALETLNNEFAKADFPGIYILQDTNANKLYIGEAKNVYYRLKTHTNNPEDKIKNWNMALVINDGRIATQSDFNDNVIRLSIEIYLIKLFKLNKYNVVAQGDEQTLNGQQKSIFNSLLSELNFFLLKKGLITKLMEKKNEAEILLDSLQKILIKNGYKIDKWHTYEPIINGKKFFIRAGSKKTKGWQVTFRDIFKNTLKASDGFLIMPRGSILIIPFSNILELFEDKENVFANNTIDIFIEFLEDGRILMNYKNKTIDVTKFALLKEHV